MKILIVEDEKSLAELVADRLRKEKYTVDISFDGANEFTDSGDNLEMEEMLDDWIIANGDNPYDIDTRFDAIKDPFGFADKD